ncbi:tumor necrosis factor receptor superfamily member 6-like [Elgaria multicarinata webbii]|uniref:tumor necrosis factor receptor superfamily member 6-like n=1 Tax=Elgaria multicarinata webbii TaxID=159646 RepID=UPI002FCCF096
MKLWPALWALLALVAKVESPALRINCNDGEYPYSGQCCKKCPAGTHVGEHCSAPQTLGICMPCTEGEDYTKHENALLQCLSCDECNSGFRMVRPCTVKSNTECQCKEGYYCPPGYEECIRCKTKCPEGKETVRKCSATTDMECGPVPAESTNPTLIWGLTSPFVVLLVVVISIWGVRKCRSKKDEEKDGKDYLIQSVAGSNLILNSKPEGSTSESCESRNELIKNADRSNLALGGTDEEPGFAIAPSAPPQQSEESAIRNVQSNLQVLESNKPQRVIVKKLSSERAEKLKKIYFGSISMVLPRDRISHMRKSGLSENDIAKIKYDNPNDTDEQYYQMLKTLQDRFGIDDALYKLLDGLWHMKLNGIYENLINELVCNDIITLETKD